MKFEISIREIFRRPSAFLPILMSLAAAGLIVVHVATDGVAPQRDEGTAAHLWQLLMAAQIPVIAFFLIRWMPQFPRATLLVLAAQVGAALAALAPIYFLRW